MKFASFDLEISRPTGLPEDGDIPKHKDIWDYSPFHITVAGVHLSDTNHTSRWYGWNGGYAPWMLKDEVTNLLMYLSGLRDKGYILTTWNGTAFDWRLLAQETGQHKLCAELALKSFDPMLLVHGLKGYPIGLKAAADGFSLGKKTQDGGNAPLLWEQGLYEDVLVYVEQDARLLGLVVQSILKHRGIKWVSDSGVVNFLPFTKLLLAGKVRDLPYPDTSWMTEPIAREAFFRWTLEAQ
jgi:hypothetical protein